MKRTVPNVATKQSAFPIFKMTAYDATVTMVTQENLAVSLELRFTVLDANYSIETESIPNRFSSLLIRTKKLRPAVTRWFQFQWRVYHQSRWRQSNTSVV